MKPAPLQNPVALVVYSGERRRIPLERRPLLLGRAEDCDVVLADETVSRRHCRLVPEGETGWCVEDLGGQVGTLVDGRRVEGSAALRRGAWLRLGEALLQFGGTVEPALVLTGQPTRDAFLMEELLGALEGFADAEEPDQILRTIVDRGIRVAGGERGALFLPTGGDTLELALARDVERGDLAADALLTRTLPQRALLLSRPVVIPDAGDLPAGETTPPSLTDSGRRSVVCVPLPGSGAARGVLYVDSLQPARSLGTAELAVLAVLAGQASRALDRAEDARARRAERECLRAENLALRARLGDEPVGQALRPALDLARRVAASSATVCIVGGTGTGKEVLARHVHRLSPRGEGPFVVVDCGALPEALVESELFGHEKGSFTGAGQSRQGRLREAAGGTVFLDEIGELPLALQPRLLRFLQDRMVRPIGGSPVHVDTRVLSATHRDLKEMVAAGTFREDLYYRIAVLTIAVPPLRERGDDVLLLASRFLRQLQDEDGPVRGFTREAEAALRQHAWPGNVRELEHRVQRAVLVAGSPFVTTADLGLAEGEAAHSPHEEAVGLLPLREARERASQAFELAYAERLLAVAERSVSRAAALAGVSRQAVHALLKRYGLDGGGRRSPSSGA